MAGLPAVGYGDSITNGLGALQDGGTRADAWLALLATEHGIPTINQGVSGDTSREIAVRHGARTFTVTIDGGMITDTSVGIASTVNPARAKPVAVELTLTDGTPVRGVIAKTPDAPQALTFTRATPGPPIPADGPLAARCTLGDKLTRNIHIIWAGTNNILDTAQVISDIAAMVTSHPKAPVLVVSAMDRGATEGLGTAKGAAVRTVNAWAERTYGPDAYVDMRRYLIDHGLADAGIPPTAQDVRDIAADGVPRSLRTGGLHPNVPCNALIAAHLAPRLRHLAGISPRIAAAAG